MVLDRLQALRVVLAVPDGAAALAVVREFASESAGHWNGGVLQMEGDVALLALSYDARAAGAAAARCSAALRDRRWDGDAELADAIDVALGVAGAQSQADPLVALPVDLEELGDLLDSGPDSEGGRIDLTNGEVWPEMILQDGWPGTDDELEDEDRWLEVWPATSRAGYQDMVDFADTRRNQVLVDRLEFALTGRGAFRRFKDTLASWPADREEWFAFSADRRRGRARAWLADAGYRSAVRLADDSSASG